jgi:hypothetical protein
MREETNRLQSAPPQDRGQHWRAVSFLLLFQALGFAGAAVLAYLMLAPELAKDYFSAHRTVKKTWQLVIPSLAVSAGAGFLLLGAGTALGLRSHSRRLLEPLRQIEGQLAALASGRIPRPRQAQRANAVDQVAATLAPLRLRVEELRRISRDLEKVSLELNFRAAGTGDLTRKDLRALTAQLDALTKDLSGTVGWFEG